MLGPSRCAARILPVPIKRPRAIDDGRDAAALQVESALWVTKTVTLDKAGKNIQIHGGIVFSDKEGPYLFLERAPAFDGHRRGRGAADQRIADTQSGW
jgi:hypothetical protein